jgi:lipopolysaccharide transport system ATP-binding protein
MNNKKSVIKIENISKCFRIGIKSDIRDNISGAVFDFLKSPLKNYQKYRSLYRFDDIVTKQNLDIENHPSDIIWALNNVSFEVTQGEIVGIIGRNGAGKSTLLKILSRITYPTSGRAEIRGRISSLLEVGTGFHPELTGRENVYLNGTILGMRKYEIDRKFDEIVEFSGIEKFIDTPVKRYSSGMRVRLAFSVAAHLEPEILLIDEVLAVGDARFQKKCLDKMDDVGQQGRTVLFVSHNMPAVTRLCPRTILLDNGRLMADGPTHRVVSAYLDSGTGTTAAREWPELAEAPGDDVVRLLAVRVRTEKGQITDAVDIRQPIGLEMEYEVLKTGHKLLPYHYLFNEEGVRVFATVDQDPAWRDRKRPTGRYISIAWIPGNLLAEGRLFVGSAMRAPEMKVRYFHEREVVSFHVIDSLDGDSARGDFTGHMSGTVRPLLKWETQFSANES